MGRPYSNDFRERVVKVGGLSRRQAAPNLWWARPSTGYSTSTSLGASSQIGSAATGQRRLLGRTANG